MGSTHVPDEVQVRDAADHIEVVGLSEHDVKQAIALLHAAGEERLQARMALYTHVNRAMLDAAIPLISPATQRQAHRNAALREQLLQDHGYETYASLAQRRESQESSARTWVSRERDKGNAFTVRAGGQVLIPAVQLTADGRLNKPVSELVRPLLEVGIDGWSIWSWLCSPTDLLSGATPAEVATENPDRALKAAQRFAAEIRRADANVA